MIQAPKLDNRDSKSILKELIKLVPFYTPEWNLTGISTDAGSALAHIFAEMINELIKRLNKTPDKYFAAFLNMLGVKLLPPKQATAPVTFKLSEGTVNSVPVPSYTKLTATSPGNGVQIFFETSKSLLVVPSSITYAYSFCPKKDIIIEINRRIISGQPYSLDIQPSAIYDFSDDSLNLQSHGIYIGHKPLNTIKGHCVITINCTGKKIDSLCIEAIATWQYFGKRINTSNGTESIGWYDFSTIEFFQNNIYLYKLNDDEITESEVSSNKSGWLRCLIKPSGIDNVSEVEINTIGITSNLKSNLLPDKAFYNDVPLDMGESGFYPLGTNPKLYDTFYFSCKEAFSRYGAKIEILFEIEHTNITTNNGSTATLSWEYWDSAAWQIIKLQTDETQNFNLSGHNRVIFYIPSDIGEADVNGQSDYWIKVRLAGGDFGKESYTVKHDGDTYHLNVDYSQIKPPKIKNMRITCEPQTEKPDFCYINNNLEYVDKTIDINKNSGHFKPFYKIDGAFPALYLCFSNKLEGGPISLYFSFIEKNNAENKMPEINWEYAIGNSRWAKLSIADNTKNFTCSGTVEIIGMPDSEITSVFGKEGYWIRAVDAKGNFDNDNNSLPSPITDGIFFNTTTAINLETIVGEVLGSSTETATQTFFIQKKPVFSEEIWVNEIKKLSKTEIESIKAQNLQTFEEVTDSDDNTNEFWIKWHAVDDLSTCTPQDRVYETDRVLGTVKFGDDLKGAIPPVGTDNIKINYRFGGGYIGNIPAMTINALNISIPFIDSVFNPQPTNGGFDSELLDNSLKRGPQILRNRSRAVSYNDFEWISKEASSGVARSKCIPCMNSSNTYETGWITVIIMPWSKDKQPKPSLELKLAVQEYLQSCTETNAAFNKHIRVISPVYIEISIKATLTAYSFDMATSLESKAVSVIDTFLHPLTGGFDSNGLEFGIIPAISDFYKLLQGLDEVKYVKKLSMTVNNSESGTQSEINMDTGFSLIEPDIKPYCLTSSGKHTILVSVEE